MVAGNLATGNPTLLDEPDAGRKCSPCAIWWLAYLFLAAVLQVLALRRHTYPGLLGWIPDACADKAKGDSLHARFHSGTDKPMNALSHVTSLCLFEVR